MSGIKAQGQVSAYQKFVIDGLVDIEGHSEGDVTARIIGEWVRANGDLLAQYGLSVDDWRRSNRPAPDNVVALGKKQAGAPDNDGATVTGESTK